MTFVCYNLWSLTFSDSCVHVTGKVMGTGHSSSSLHWLTSGDSRCGTGCEGTTQVGVKPALANEKGSKGNVEKGLGSEFAFCGGSFCAAEVCEYCEFAECRPSCE